MKFQVILETFKDVSKKRDRLRVEEIEEGQRKSSQMRGKRFMRTSSEALKGKFVHFGDRKSDYLLLKHLRGTQIFL